MSPKTKRVTDLPSNPNSEDTSNRQAQGRRSTPIDPVATRQEHLKMIFPFTTRPRVSLPILGILTSMELKKMYKSNTISWN